MGSRSAVSFPMAGSAVDRPIDSYPAQLPPGLCHSASDPRDHGPRDSGEDSLSRCFFQRLIDQRNEFRDVEGLEQIPCGPMPDTFHRGSETAVSGNDDHFDIGMICLISCRSRPADREFLVQRRSMRC